MSPRDKYVKTFNDSSVLEIGPFRLPNGGHNLKGRLVGYLKGNQSQNYFP